MKMPEVTVGTMLSYESLLAFSAMLGSHLQVWGWAVLVISNQSCAAWPVFVRPRHLRHFLNAHVFGEVNYSTQICPGSHCLESI